MCRLCFEDEGKLEKIFEMEETLISAVNDLLFKVKRKQNKINNRKNKNLFFRLQILRDGPVEYVNRVN